MKTILIPTDYSEAADNALMYAVELAKFSKAKLILFHAYHVPVPATEVPIMIISPGEIEKETTDRIKNLERKIKEKHAGEIELESIVREGFASDILVELADEKGADLIVMGITGAGKAVQALIGSNATIAMKSCKVPVLVVPAGARYRPIKKIALACSFSDRVSEKAIEKVKQFAKLFSAEVLVVDVEEPVSVPMYEIGIEGEKLENSLRGVKHEIFFFPAKDIAAGIKDFTENHTCDWLVMIPHEHNFLGRLLHKSNSKRMAFRTQIPLLSIHESTNQNL